MASAQVVETSVTNNSPSQDSYHPDDLFQSRYATPGFKPFSYFVVLLSPAIMPFSKHGGSPYFGLRTEKVACLRNSKRKLIEATVDKQKNTPVNDNTFRKTTRLVLQTAFKKWSYHCPGDD